MLADDIKVEDVPLRPTQGFTGAQIRMVQENEEMVSKREQEIQELTKSVNELADMFRDLAQLVVDQVFHHSTLALTLCEGDNVGQY